MSLFRWEVCWVDAFTVFHFFASGYCFLVFVHFFISSKLKSQSKSVSTMSEMFTEFLDIPSIVHFAVLHLEFIVPEKRVCDILLPAMHLMCHTNIVRKKKKKKSFFLLCRSRTNMICLHTSRVRGFMCWCWSKVVWALIQRKHKKNVKVLNSLDNQFKLI